MPPPSYNEYLTNTRHLAGFCRCITLHGTESVTELVKVIELLSAACQPCAQDVDACGTLVQ